MSRNIIIYPNRDTVASGSEPYISFSGASAGTINLVVEDQGELVYEGNSGALFTITDNKDGLLHSVNDVSGLPILAVYDDNKVELGKWNDLAQTIIDNQTFIGPTTTTTSLLHISGGTLTYKDGNQQAGYVLTSDADGIATWQVAAAGADGNDFVTGATLNNNSIEVDRNDSPKIFTISGGTNVTITESPTKVFNITSKGSVRKYVSTDSYTGSVTTTITHSLNDADVIVQVYDDSGNQIIPQIKQVDVNNVDITIATGGTYKTVIMA